jgi:NAD(P)-dependent dehydrogenase (short-subunit alcohol dehydrogenase family)
MNILITGGASGLGEAITRLLAQEKNHRVYFTYNSSVDQAKIIEAEHSNATGIKCDFRDPHSILELKSQLVAFDIDVLVNNALTGLEKKHFHKTDPELFLSGFKHNILPTIHIAQAAINHFRKKKFGKIITILSSYIINKPPTGLSGYVASKAYLHALSKSWSTENASFNISSNCISPSFMQTQLTQDTDERIIEDMQKNHPLKSLLQTNEVADAVGFLVNATQHINGMNLIINAASDIV